MKHSATERMIAYIGLGSNLASPSEQIKSARHAIAATIGIKELAFSSLYHSLPMGPQDQPDYINAVMCIETTLAPIELLHRLQHIEKNQGRIRLGERWGARTLDLDVLLYGETVLDLPELTVPHIGIAERSFVLYPLHEIAPQQLIPNKGVVADLIASCPLAGLERLG